MGDPRQWAFIADMNHTGSITISDVWLWFKWLYFYPGDYIINLLIGTDMGRFLEVSYYSYGGILSGIISFIIWIIVLGIIGLMSN